MSDYEFPDMAYVIPEQESGDWRIRHIVISEKTEVSMRATSLITSDWTRYLTKSGTYVTLEFKGQVVMSDTNMERLTNQGFLNKARGDVLMLGLGLGMLPLSLCHKDDVKSVLVIEKEPAVVRMVMPYIKNSKLQVVIGDAFSPPLGNVSHDFVYIDIWQEVSLLNWPDMKRLLDLYDNLEKYARVSAWLEDYVCHKYAEALTKIHKDVHLATR